MDTSLLRVLRGTPRPGTIALAGLATALLADASSAAVVASYGTAVWCPAQDTSTPVGDKPPSKPGDENKPDPQAPTILETIVVSSERGVPLTYPGGRDVIEPETIAKYPDASVGTQLRRIPGVNFLPENGNDSRISVGLRGNNPRRSGLTTLMVDGIPVCEAPYGNTDVDGLPIAPERIWRTDVIRGGGSIRYGPNSAGGIINFLTEPVPDAPMLRLGARYGSYDAYSGSVTTGGTWEDLGVLVSGVAKGGDGFRDNSEFDDQDGAVKLRYAFTPTESVSAYASRFVEYNALQPGGLTQAAYDTDPTQSLRTGADFDFDVNRYVLQYDNEISAESSLQLRAWYQEGFRHLFDYRPIVQPFTVTREQNSDFDSSAIEANYTWTTQLFGVKNAFTHSARYLTESNDEFYVRTPIGGGPPVTPYELNALFKGQSFSLFNEDVISLADNLDWGIGFRLENIVMSGHSHDSGRDVIKDYGLFLPETTLTWTVEKDTAIYGSYQESFYPPQYETGFDPASILYAPTDPESSQAYEVGVRSRAIDGLEGSLALFDTEFYDKIDFINTSAGLKIPVNSGHATARGVEVGLNYELGAASRSLEGLSVYGSVTSQESKFNMGANKGNDTPNSPNLLASWGAEYIHAPTGLWARFGGSYTGDAFSDPANTPVGSADGINGPEPAYTLWDCAVGWNQHPDRTGFGVSLGITNLFDEAYFRRFVSGIYPGEPRQEFVAVTYGASF